MILYKFILIVSSAYNTNSSGLKIIIKIQQRNFEKILRNLTNNEENYLALKSSSEVFNFIFS